MAQESGWNLPEFKSRADNGSLLRNRGSGNRTRKIRKTGNRDNRHRFLRTDAGGCRKKGGEIGSGKAVADAAELPFDKGYFDAVGIAFGFRNLTFKNPKSEQYLKEIYRVIAPGGRLVIVETSQPESTMLKKLSGIYYSSVVKPVGNVISGQAGAYTYLAYSARNYFKPSDVENMLKHVGFTSVEYRSLLRGIAGVHVALK
jgi:ubiquinone/menaquinone biosynthesis methyltransferase